MSDRPIPKGYYALAVGVLRDFLDGSDPNAQLHGEVDSRRFPIIKITRDADGAVVLRVPPSRVRDDELVICTICRQVAAHPEYRGKIWAKKDGSAVAMSWSATLIQAAGGLDRLFAEWEPE